MFGVLPFSLPCLNAVHSLVFLQSLDLRGATSYVDRGGTDRQQKEWAGEWESEWVGALRLLTTRRPLMGGRATMLPSSGANSTTSPAVVTSTTSSGSDPSTGVGGCAVGSEGWTPRLADEGAVMVDDWLLGQLQSLIGERGDLGGQVLPSTGEAAVEEHDIPGLGVGGYSTRVRASSVACDENCNGGLVSPGTTTSCTLCKASGRRRYSRSALLSARFLPFSTHAPANLPFIKGITRSRHHKQLNPNAPSFSV